MSAPPPDATPTPDGRSLLGRFDRERRAHAALVLSVLLAFGGILQVTMFVEHAQNHHAWAEWLPVALLYGVPSAALGTVALLFATVLTVRRPDNAWAPLLAFTLMLSFSAAQTASWPYEVEVQHGQVLPTAALLLITIARYRHPTDPVRSEAEWVEATAGAAAALYCWSALSKLWGSGLSWAWNLNLPLLMLERAYGSSNGEPSWVFQQLSESPNLMVALASATWIMEGLGFLLLFPAWRARTAVLYTFMHLSIGLLMGYWYFEWWLILWALAWLTPVYRDQADSRG